MAKRKKTVKSTDKKSDKKNSSDITNGIWGIIFLSLGFLVLLSLLSHFVAPGENILGPVLGDRLASGMIYFFGSLSSLNVPVSILLIGWSRLKAEPLKYKHLLFFNTIALQLCVLFAIRHLPHISPDYISTVQSNYLGVMVIQFIKPVFGNQVFGPYFLTVLAMTVTVLYALKIKPQFIAHFFAGWIQQGWSWVCKTYDAMIHSFKASPPIRSESDDSAGAKRRSSQKEKEKNDKNQDKEEKTPEIQTPVIAQAAVPALEESAREAVGAPVASGPKNPGIEEDAKKRLEEEIAAFRAKKSQPIQIMSIETQEVESEAESEIDEDNYMDGGTIPVDIAQGAEGEVDSHLKMTKPSVPQKPYVVPSAEVIPDPPPLTGMIDKETIERNSVILEKTLMNFGVEGKVVFVSPGPVVTRYEIELAPGIKVSKVVGLHDDISMAVSGQRIRIEAPIPGKSAVGIELPNPERQIVHFKTILTSDVFRKTRAKVPVIIGTNISGAPYVTDITKMPHVLIAGQTGSGKSVCINSIICSMLMTKKPEELRLIMIDPKKVELAFYEGIPHLLSPVVTESKLAVKALQWGVVEMERRYRMLAKVGARNIESFNTRVDSGKLKGILPDEDNKQLPFIVIIVDELADLMMTASKDVEGLIQRIAQLARAVGIHLIVATQRPSVDIITGPIKANLTSRIGFRTIQSTDSRTILGHVGAEKLLGMGDMLFLRNGAPEIERFHGAFISEEDVETIVEEVRSQQIEIEKIDSFQDAVEEGGPAEVSIAGESDRDELFEDAARTIVSIGQGSTSLLQRRMKIGYARAGRLMDELERAGIVGPQEGSKVREVLLKPAELDELMSRWK
ncbi:DNA translocase FtsK [Chitinispirillales bacterium ANBcel5]|uniref:DNA translocase FtsK n=1 Tax=Cellulosispirillum alkaliphilum TaxID=3039283 RepID=UPI002A5227E2|nr:DNA translocase FtsK [Chitinispirillales bacterium ANBcel5]